MADNLNNCWIERTGLRACWSYVVYFWQKYLVHATLERNEGAVSGKAFYHLPNFCGRLVVDVSDVQNSCQEDDFASSITLLAFTRHRLKIITSRKSLVRFILLKACFLFFTAMLHCLFHHGTAILRDLFD